MDGAVEVMTLEAVARALETYRAQVMEMLARRELTLATIDARAAVLVTPALREWIAAATQERKDREALAGATAEAVH